MRKPQMQELKRPKHWPANDNRPTESLWPADRTPPSTRSTGMQLTVVISSVLGLAVGSCLLGVGAVELCIRWM